MTHHLSSPNKYDTSAIRKLLMAVFNDEEFTIFCYDHFQDAHQKFAEGMSFPKKVQVLIDYCARHDVFDPLLALVEESNPGQYAELGVSIKKTIRILIVDDSADWQKTLRGLLVDAGYEVTTAGNEEQAQNLAEQIPFDLAVIDFHLHGDAEYDESGLVLAHVLKKLVPHMKVVLLTGYPPRIDQVAKSFKFFEVEDFIDKSRIYGSEERDLAAIVKKILGTP